MLLFPCRANHLPVTVTRQPTSFTPPWLALRSHISPAASYRQGDPPDHHGARGYTGTLPHSATLSQHTSSFAISTSTYRAAQNAIIGMTLPRPQPQSSIEDKEEELEGTVLALRKQGRIGKPTHTPAVAERSVQKLPALRVSPKLTRAAAIAQRERVNGFQLLRGMRPRSSVSRKDMAVLQTLMSGRARSRHASQGRTSRKLLRLLP
jgi:hypothetical protein